MKQSELLVTRAELAELSGFELPREAASDPSGWKALRRGRVPALTVHQVRTWEKLGLFDEPVTFTDRGDKMPLTVWRRPSRARGQTRTYSLLDVMTVRLLAWMLRQGLTRMQIVSVLRGPWSARYTLLGHLAQRHDTELCVSGMSGCVLPRAEVSEYAELSLARFPLAWLGITTDAGPRIQKMREANGGQVWRFNRLMPIAQIAALDHQASA